VWIIPFDQFRDEQRLVEIERDLPAAHADFDLAIVCEQALQFYHRFCRNNKVRFMAARELQLDLDHGTPPPIGCDQRQLGLLETEKDPVENVASLICRYGIGSLTQSVAQILLPNRDNLRVFEFWQRRKFFFGQPENFEKALSAPNGSGVLSIDIYLNFARRQFTNDVEQTTCRQCGPSLFLYVCFTTAAYADIEIGCCEMNFVAVRLQKNIGKNRKSSAGADHVLDLLQAFKQFFFRYTEFHYDGLRCKALGFI